MLIKPVLRDHLTYVTLFYVPFESSHKTGLTIVQFIQKNNNLCNLENNMHCKHVVQQCIKGLIYFIITC